MTKAGRKTKHGVLICGAYGMHNAGDEAVLAAILAEMRGIDAEMPITVMTRLPQETAARHGVNTVFTFDLPRVLRVMRRSELFVNGGGSLLQDVSSSRSLWYYLFTLAAAKRRGCKVLMYGCGVGPIRRGPNRRLAGRVVERNVDAITLREENSLQELRSLGVSAPDIRITSDPALSLAGVPEADADRLLLQAGLEPGGRYLFLSLRRWPGVQDKLELFAAAADYAWEAYGLQPVLYPVNTQQDSSITQMLAARIHAPCAMVKKPLDAAELVGFIGRMNAVLSMRLHVLIFAASHAVALAGVSYDPKVASFLDYLGQTNYVDYDALTDKAQLCALVDAAATADLASLRQAAEHVTEIERQNTEAARRLLGREG